MLIEINLAPGAASARARPSRFSGVGLPSLPKVGLNPRVLLGSVAGLLLLGLLGTGYWRMGARYTELDTRIQREVTDSTRYASVIELIRALQARQDTIARKIEIIRSVDSRRFVWPHLLDEIGLAVPQYVWLTEISSIEVADSTATGPEFTVQGNAGNTQALTRFMKDLENSPFIGNVTLVTSEQQEMEGRVVQSFSLQARYHEPDPSVIETIPVFGPE